MKKLKAKEEIKTTEFGTIIYRSRLERNYTQKEFAKLIGVTDRTVSKWEKGTTVPDLYQLRNISTVLGISPNLLLKSETAFKDDVNNLKRKLGRIINYIINNIFLLSFILVFTLLLIFFLNNYDTVRIYSLKYNSDNVYINHGYLFKTKTVNILTIENISLNKIKYTPKEINLELYTLANGDKKVLYSADNLDNIYIEESDQAADLLTKDTINNMKRNIHLLIKTKDEDGKTYEYDCEIVFKEKYVNNKLLYSRYVKDSKLETEQLINKSLSLFSSKTNPVVATSKTTNMYEEMGFTYDETDKSYNKVDSDGRKFKYLVSLNKLEYEIKDNEIYLYFICKNNQLKIVELNADKIIQKNTIINFDNNESFSNNKYYKIYKDEIDYILSVYKALSTNVQNGE